MKPRVISKITSVLSKIGKNSHIIFISKNPSVLSEIDKTPPLFLLLAKTAPCGFFYSKFPPQNSSFKGLFAKKNKS